MRRRLQPPLSSQRQRDNHRTHAGRCLAREDAVDVPGNAVVGIGIDEIHECIVHRNERPVFVDEGVVERRIQERAVVKDGAIVARPMMYVALTYDHRLVDGREAVQFLRRIKDCIESPARILLEI